MLGLISKKKAAMEQGYQSYEVLKNYVSEKMKEEILDTDECTPCFTPKEMLDLLYSSSQYEDFVINSLVLKKICTKLAIIQITILIAITLLCVGIFTFLKLTIVGIILAIILDIAFLFKFKSGKSYQEYYNETMTKILNMAVSEYTIKPTTAKTSITKDFLDKYLDINYSKYFTKFNYNFESKYEVGDDFELELKKLIKTKDNEGNESTKEETIFDGFSIVSKNKQPHKILNGSIIKIREDENVLSALLEDSVNSIVHNQRDFSFNSEKLNKHLDCTLTRTGFTSDVDQKMFEVTKIITPSFEEKLLFLDERYNAFNMNISDNEFSFNVSMKKDAYQKLQNGELFTLNTTYKRKKCNTNIFTETNFEYEKLYPMLERLFLLKYFRVIYNYQMDSSRFNNYDNKKIEQYESEIKSIMDMPWKEFSQPNENYVKNLKEKINEKYNSLK